MTQTTIFLSDWSAMVKRKATLQPKQDAFTLLVQSQLGLECVREFRFHPERKWRFDYAVPERKVALEVEGGVWTGGRHTSSKGFLNDMEKYNTATVMGWKVVRTTPKDLYTAATLTLMRDACLGSQE